MAGESERDPATNAPPGEAEAQAKPAEKPEAKAAGAEKLSPEAKAAAAEKAKAAAAAKKAAAAKDEGPPRALPSQDDIARWAAGGDANVGILFEGLPIARFDAFVTKIRNEEIVPQHWQVISALRPPDDDEFERLPEVGRLRQLYREHALARRRLPRGTAPPRWRADRAACRRPSP